MRQWLQKGLNSVLDLDRPWISWSFLGKVGPKLVQRFTHSNWNHLSNKKIFQDSPHRSVTFPLAFAKEATEVSLKDKFMAYVFLDIGSLWGGCGWIPPLGEVLVQFELLLTPSLVPIFSQAHDPRDLVRVMEFLKKADPFPHPLVAIS